MIKRIKNWLSQEAPTEDIDETEEAPEEVEEDFAPVSVRVNPPTAVRAKPADTYVQGYTVDEDGIDRDDEHATTVNDIKTTGIDPYNAGGVQQLDAEKPNSEK